MAEAGSGAVPRDGAPGDRSKGVNGYVLNTITPETDKSCLYFWAFARNYCIGEQRLTHELREGVAGIFREDELVLEAQQRAIDERPDYSFYNLNIDAGAMWARRLIDQMIAQGEAARRRPSRSGPPRRSDAVSAAPSAPLRPSPSKPAARRRSRRSCGCARWSWPANCRAARASPKWRSSELLGVSRTPVRSALMRLEQEGLLEALPNGGYAVRTFSERDVSDAIELRGTLEGLAARLAAERGAPPVVLREARACLQRIDELLREPALDDAAFSRYVAFNEQFHRAAVRDGGQPADRAAAGARDQPAVRLALGLRGGAGQLAGRARHAA